MKSLVLAIALSLSSFTLLAAPAVQAQQASVVCDQIKRVDPSATCDKASSESTFGRVARTVVQVLVFIIGALSVLAIIVGGIMYVASGGDPNNTKRAKDTILYAIVGLVVALLAQSIVSFVLSRVG